MKKKGSGRVLTPSKEHWNGPNGILLATRVCTDWLPTSNRFHVAQEKQFSRKRKNMCCTPFSSLGGPNGPTERPDRTGANRALFDEHGHHCRWRWTLIAHQHAVVLSWHVQNVVVRTDLAGEAQDSGWTQTRFYLGTERTTMNSLVPFRSVPQGRIELGHALIRTTQAVHVVLLRAGMM